MIARVMTRPELVEVLEAAVVASVRSGEALRGAVEFSELPRELVPPDYEELPESVRALYDERMVEVSGGEMKVYRLREGEKDGVLLRVRGRIECVNRLIWLGAP